MSTIAPVDLDDLARSWLAEHANELQQATRAYRKSGRVTAALHVTRAHPMSEMTPETLAAAVVTADYLLDEGRTAELLADAASGENARAHAYAGRVLLELLQNAEDAYREADSEGPLRLRAYVEEGRVVVDVSHDGDAFDSHDIDAFRRMYSSTKRDSVKRIGKFGVGVKSILSVADALSLHSGGFHLHFPRRTLSDTKLPFFLLPVATVPREGGGRVLMQLWWRPERASTPEGALGDLLAGFSADHLLFLSRVHSVVVDGRVAISLARLPPAGPFEVFAVDGQPGEQRWRIGDPASAAAAFRVVVDEGGIRRLVAAPDGSRLAAYFPIGKTPAGVGAWVHAPFALADDRESLSLASTADQEWNAQCLDAIASLMRSASHDLQRQEVEPGALPAVLLGPPEHAARSLTASSSTRESMRLGVSADVALVRSVTNGEVPWPVRDGRLVPAAEVLFGGIDHDAWDLAFPDDPALPARAAADWLTRGPAQALGVSVAGPQDFAERVSPLCTGTAAGRLFPLRDVPQAHAWLVLALRVSRRFGRANLAALPVPVLGEPTSGILVASDDIGLDGADLADVGLTTIDPAAFGPWTGPARAEAIELLIALGGRRPNRSALLEAADRITAHEHRLDRDSAALRITAAALQLSAEPLESRASVWQTLFRVECGWGATANGRTVDAVYARRVRVPMEDGVWRPLAHGTLGALADVPPAWRIDVTAVARTLRVSHAAARDFLKSSGAWEQVPVLTWEVLPWTDPGALARERARFRAAVPADGWDPSRTGPWREALFRFLEPGATSHVPAGTRPWPDQPGAKHLNLHDVDVKDRCAGYSPWAPLEPLAQAALPEGIGPNAMSDLARGDTWHGFDSVPLWCFRNSYRYYNVAAPGHFPTLLALQLRARVQLPLAEPTETSKSAPAATLLRLDRYRARRPAAAAQHLPLVAERIVETWSPGSLDRLHVVPRDSTKDPRHLLRALAALAERTPGDPDVPVGRALVTAHRDLWDDLVDLVTKRDPTDRSLLAYACADAAVLGWIPRAMSSPEGLPVLVRDAHHTGPARLSWRTVSTCRTADARACAFYDPDPHHYNERTFSETVAFVALGRNLAPAARMLGIPVFQPGVPAFELVASPEADLAEWLRLLIRNLVPWLRRVVTEQAAGGGIPMTAERFDERADRANLTNARIEFVAAWPGTLPLHDPPNSEIDRPSGALSPFRYVEALADGAPAFLVHAGQVKCIADAQTHLWRLDLPLAEALETAGHAPHLQNLLRALDSDRVDQLRTDPNLMDMLGAPADDAPEGHSEPTVEADVTGVMARLFGLVRARAAAIVLAHGDAEEARRDAERGWDQSSTRHRLFEQAHGGPEERVHALFGIRVGTESREAFAEALATHVDDPLLLEQLDAILRRRRGHLTWRGVVFGDSQELDQALAAAAAELELPPAGRAAVVKGGQPAGAQGNAGAGTSRFASRSSATGRLGEHYAIRWLALHLAQGDASRVFDVSTPEARKASAPRFPSDYPGGSAFYSPGVDLLVFDTDGEWPLGIEVKSRRGDGPINFEWTRNERERCRRVVHSECVSHDWPLRDYRVLVVSRLEPGEQPNVVLLEAVDLLEAADPAAFVVRARSEP